MPAPRKIALKRLTHSDLTLFKRYFDVNGTSKQKGINLNANVLVDVLYPGLPDTGSIPIQLIIQGPGLTEQPQLLMRKIVKSASAKNWRLNGELVNDPEGADRDRYSLVQPDDIALMEFFDDPAGGPSRLRMVVLGQAVADDSAPYEALSDYLGTRSMMTITPTVLVRKVGAILPDGHPVQSFLTDDTALELLAEGVAVDLVPDAATAPATPASPAGGAPRTRTYTPVDFNKAAKPSLRRVSAESLSKAKAVQAGNGVAGEELVNAYFTSQSGAGTVEWSSKINAVSPYDFHQTDGSDEKYIEVKTTSEAFEAPFHISIGEIKQAAHAPAPYHIYRVYDIKTQPKLRISGDISGLAKKIIEQAQAFQSGVVPDGFTLYPGILASEVGFGDEIVLDLDEY